VQTTGAAACGPPHPLVCRGPAQLMGDTLEVMFCMKRLMYICIACVGLIASVWADSGDTEKERITDSSNVLKAILEAPDKGIPGSVLDGTKCVIVLPSVKKAALGIGASYGRGTMSCRTGSDFKGPWSGPIMMATESGSIGFQIGGQGTDFVILVLNDDGARAVMKSKIKLGADASIAAGPVGRTAEASTTGNMQAQMLSYSRSKGVFGGVSLSGASLRVDGDANKNLYGEKVTPQQIMGGEVPTPDVAKPLIEQLTVATKAPAPTAK
jgi:SH3 domain-containing YSC84-like protein 1